MALKETQAQRRHNVIQAIISGFRWYEKMVISGALNPTESRYEEAAYVWRALVDAGFDVERRSRR